MRRKEPSRRRRGSKLKSRIQSYRQSIKNNRILTLDKVIKLLCHLISQLLHGIAGILVICLWIIVGCTCSHIIFVILLYIQVLLHKDRLVIIWSKKTLIAAKSVRRAQNKIQNIYSRGGVPQACLTPKKENYNGCVRRSPWTSKRRL